VDEAMDFGSHRFSLISQALIAKTKRSAAQSYQEKIGWDYWAKFDEDLFDANTTRAVILLPKLRLGVLYYSAPHSCRYLLYFFLA